MIFRNRLSSLVLAIGCLLWTGCRSSENAIQSGRTDDRPTSEGRTEPSGGTWETPEAVPSTRQSSQPVPPSGEWVPAGDSARPSERELTEEDFRGVAGPLLPRPQTLSHWSYLYPPDYYSASNLYEFIDGGADSYLRYGFEQAVNAVLRLDTPPDSITREVTAEITIFSMANTLAAQNKFDEDHSDGPCEIDQSLDHRHCLTSSSLDLLIGSYYVRFLLDSDELALRAPLMSLVRQVLAAHEASLQPPTEPRPEGSE